MKPHGWEMFYHKQRYPIHVITFEAASTRDTFALPFLAAPMRLSPVNSDVRVYVDDLTAENGEKNDK
jgi:hypothetical protein